MSEKIENEKEIITLRIPTKLKVHLEQMAQDERRSVNQQVIVVLEAATKYLREHKAEQVAA